MTKYGFLASAALMTIAAHGPALAQQAEEGETASIAEIIVTATKRAQTLQDVPIAVTAITAEQLQTAGITDVRELQALSPSLFLSSSSSEVAGTTARIRGVGTTGDNPGLESAVAIFIDGVYRPRNNIGLTELGEVERIEVLRGPQGTLFGRNASAGLINVVTASPKFDLGGYAEASYGNYDHVRLSAGVTGAVIEDTLAARLDTVFFQRDGFMKDTVTGERYNDRDRWMARGQLLFTPTDDISLRVIGDYSKRDETCCAAVTIVRGPTAGIIEALGGRLSSGAGGLSSPDPFDRESATTPGRGFQQDAKEWGLSGELNWDFGDTSLTSITAYRDWKAFRSQDIDFTSLDIWYRPEDGSNQRFRTFSQEFRVNGRLGQLDWLVGAYYANEKMSVFDSILAGADYTRFADALVRQSLPTWPGYANFRPFIQAATGSAALASLAPASVAIPANAGSADTWRQTSNNWALFTHNIYNVTDALSISVGLRYTEEKKKLRATLTTNSQNCANLLGFLSNPAVPGALRTALQGLTTLPCLSYLNSTFDDIYRDSRKETEWTGTVAVNYKFSDRSSAYASFAKGYKAGGFNLDRAAMNPANPGTEELKFDAEKVDAYEVGLKWRTDDGTFSVNAAAFYSDFSDFQLNSFTGISFVVANLPEVVTKGIELEVFANPIPPLTLSSGLTIASSKYSDDMTGPAFAPPTPANPAGGGFWQLPGEQITNAPRYSLANAITYRDNLPGSSLMGLAHVDFRYTSKINTGSDLDEEKIQEGVFIVNARLGILGEDERWGIELWARNIFNKDYMQVAFDAPLQGTGTREALINTQTFNAFLAEPRTYGVTVRAKF